ncbi:hypothetical protein HDU67_009733, partial [Dinochytrium kinnereticum]
MTVVLESTLEGADGETQVGMTAAKGGDVMAVLVSADAGVEERLRCLRVVKNSIIGNNPKKRKYLRSGILP